MFRWLRWHLAKKRLASRSVRLRPGHVRVDCQYHRLEVQDLPPANAEGYEKLATFWDDFASTFVPLRPACGLTAGATTASPPRPFLTWPAGPAY